MGDVFRSYPGTVVLDPDEYLVAGCNAGGQDDALGFARGVIGHGVTALVTRLSTTCWSS